MRFLSFLVLVRQNHLLWFDRERETTRKGIINDSAKVDYGLSIEEQSVMTRGIAAYGTVHGSSSSS